MNVKPGDLAIQIKSLRGKSIGSIVEVVSGWGTWKNEFYWNVRYQKDVSVEIPEERIIRIIKAGEVTQCPDAWLRPVSGLPDNEETQSDKKLEQEA